MLFRKKPKVDIRLKAADAIEQVLVSGMYYDDDYLGSRYMCINLYTLVDQGVITTKERLEITDLIMARLGGKHTLAAYLGMCGIDVFAMDAFEQRITMSNNWWRYIRILRGQPFLDTRYD